MSPSIALFQEDGPPQKEGTRAPLDMPAPNVTSTPLPSPPQNTTDERVAAVIEDWNELPPDAKKALENYLLSQREQQQPHAEVPRSEPGVSDAEAASELALASCSSKPLSTCPAACPEALERAPENVFVYRCPETGKPLGWRNVFSHKVSYDVCVTPGLLNLDSDVLATHMLPEDLLNGSNPLSKGKRRFVVIDSEVYRLYGERMTEYFEHHGVEAAYVVLKGEECNKRWEAVDEILEQLCVFGLMRREPILGVGGGVLLDIVGLAANLYRRGVPYIRVPTTLLAIVDASVGVKNGVDWCCRAKGPQKNRVGSFYAPVGAFLDAGFIATQDERNVINGLGEIMKLALVRSTELFGLLETHGKELVESRFACSAGERVVELSIQIMLEELGPNLWEERLERCVDYGHTFSKIIEMAPGTDEIMHGEAVNVDGFLCVILARRRGIIDDHMQARVLAAMRTLGLPTVHESCTLDFMHQGLLDAVEHRHGRQRIPLITGIGSSVCVNDITREELTGALEELWELHPNFPKAQVFAAESLA